MYDLKLRSTAPTRSPNRKQFVSKILPQLAGLQELAREKEIMSGSDVSVTNSEETGREKVKDGSRESDERKEAIKRLKTSKILRLLIVDFLCIFVFSYFYYFLSHFFLPLFFSSSSFFLLLPLLFIIISNSSSIFTIIIIIIIITVILLSLFPVFAGFFFSW